jgi:outer membrane protein assembly factor BamB
MTTMRRAAGMALSGLLLALLTTSAFAADWPTWGGSPARTNTSVETGLPGGFAPTGATPTKTTPDTVMGKVKWSVKLGTSCIASPVVADGRVYIGSINNLGDARFPGDRNLLQCLDEATGTLLWSLNLKKRTNEPGGAGMACPPTIIGDHAYLFTISGSLLCLDVKGMANGNDGPFMDEGIRFQTENNKQTVSKPLVLNDKDADIIWEYDLREALPVRPEDSSFGNPVIVGDLLFINTSNGHNDREGYRYPTDVYPYPDGPSLIAVDVKTGKLVAKEAEEIGKHLVHGEWSSPSVGEIDGKPVVVYGAGDGYLYAFDASITPNTDGTPVAMKALWKCDANPVGHQAFPTAWNSKGTRTEVIATPLVNDGLVYVTTGQDTAHGSGDFGGVACVELATGKEVWTFTGVKKVDASPALANGLLFVGDLTGAIFCLDAKTGKQFWTYKAPTTIMANILVADGKVYAISDNGTLVVLAAETTQKLLFQGLLGSRAEGSPCAANGVLYVATYTTLYAVTK